jgi:hypothetical protein
LGDSPTWGHFVAAVVAGVLAGWVMRIELRRDRQASAGSTPSSGLRVSQYRNVTFYGMICGMMSQDPLPGTVVDALDEWMRAVAEELALNAHKVRKVRSIDSSFQSPELTMLALRLLLRKAAGRVAGRGISTRNLRNGGCEVTANLAGQRYRFRVKKATEDANRLFVYDSPQSLLTQSAQESAAEQLNMFTGEVDRVTDPAWVLAYLINPEMWTISRAQLGLVVGAEDKGLMSRIGLGHVIEISLSAPAPSSFAGAAEDLELDKLDEDSSADAVDEDDIDDEGHGHSSAS